MSSPLIQLTLSPDEWRKHDAPPARDVRRAIDVPEHAHVRKYIIAQAFSRTNAGNEANDPAHTWFAVDGDEPVAVSSIDPDRTVGWTACIPTHQGRGYGRAAVIAAVFDAMRGDNPQPILCGTGIENETAIGLYLSLGFVPADSSSETHLRDAGWLDLSVNQWEQIAVETDPSRGIQGYTDGDVPTGPTNAMLTDLVNEVADLLGPDRCIYALDVGCGNGRLLPILNTRFKRALGIDRALSTMVDFDNYTAGFWQTNFARYPCEAKHDAVFLIGNYYMLRPWALRRARACLKRGGILAILSSCADDNGCLKADTESVEPLGMKRLTWRVTPFSPYNFLTAIVRKEHDQPWRTGA